MDNIAHVKHSLTVRMLRNHVTRCDQRVPVHIVEAWGIPELLRLVMIRIEHERMFRQRTRRRLVKLLALVRLLDTYWIIRITFGVGHLITSMNNL